MKLSWKDLMVDFSHIDRKKLIETWTWLIGNDKTPVMISSIGDMFLSDSKGTIFWLDVGGGKIAPIAENMEELKEKMKDDNTANEWFMFDLVSKIKQSGLELTQGRLFGYKKLPVLGGEYKPDNFKLTDIEEHISLAGYVHEQLKDLPDGTRVNFKVI